MVDLEELERLANELASDTLERFLTDVGRSMRIESMCDSIPALIAEVRRLRDELDESRSKHSHTMYVMDGMQEENARLRAEVERRPEITPEDALMHTGCFTFAESCDASTRILAALRAHARKVVSK